MDIRFECDHVKVNGVSANSYYIEEGERIDILFVDGERVINDYAYLKNGNLTLGKGKAVKGDKGFIVFPPKTENYVYYQNEITDFSSELLITIFFDGGYCIVAENKDNCRINRLEGKPENVTIGESDEFYFVKYEIEGSTYLRLYNKADLNEIGVLNGQDITVNGNAVNRVFSPHDILKRKITEEYVVFSGRIERTDRSVSCARAHVLNDELLPLLFLQALACEDAQSSTYLSDELREHFNDLAEFIGEIKDIRPLFSGEYAIAGEDIKVFAFEVKNGFITNVSLLE